MNLVWFRSDLRITDNSALWNAVNKGETLGCCLLPIQQWQSYGLGERKIAFIKDSAKELKDHLSRLGINLIIKEVNGFQDQISEILSFCQKYDVEDVFWNNEYPLDERKRDARLHKELTALGIQSHQSEDALILPPGSVTTQKGEIYKVFTPFKRSWTALVEGHAIDLMTIYEFKPQQETICEQQIKPGEKAALASLEAFTYQAIEQYQDERDIPSLNATSSLSAHLSAGTISPRTCLKKALEANNLELSSGNPGIITWISQLIWREFYYHLIATQDELSKLQPFKPETKNVNWNAPAEDLENWKQGKTGVPIVDAGMRQLNSTGWMHNRVRMITAMYLTKNLLIDWRLGENYFLEKLVDADFALNNGGWQWSASTGTDAAPYFRVFNPFSQSKRFDPDGIYIKQFVPELKNIDPGTLHNEEKLEHSAPGSYPKPRISTKESRAKAILAFKDLERNQS